MAKINDLLPYTNSLSLLYMEEDQKLLHSVSDVLKKIFNRVDDADDANIALGFAKFNSYDLVIVDSLSTVISTSELILNLKSIQSNLRFIVTVKNFSDSQLLALYKLGIHAVVKKPFSASVLLDEILAVSSSLHRDRSYLQPDLDKLNSNLISERKKTGRLLVNEKKYSEQINFFQKSIHMNRNYDELTGLPTRYVLQEKIGEFQHSLLYINIDHFDFVNSIYGMGNANKLLKKTADRLSSFLPNNAEIFHITADEFVVLLTDPSKDQDYLLSKQIQALFKEAPIEFEGNTQYIAFSIGIDRGTSKILFVNAKSASKEARSFGGDQTVIYSASSLYVQEQRENFYWINVLKMAFDEDKVFTYYQPIVNNKQPEIKHYEVLCRLQDENNRLIDANKFIKSAKLIGLITQITRTVVDRAFKEFSSNDYNFSINISRYDLHEEYLVELLEYKCKTYKISKQRVYLEIIEDIIIPKCDTIDRQIIQLRELGYNLIIDDFGSDKFTFTRMFDLQVDYIKIDGSFIKELNKNASYKKMVQGIVDFAKASGIKTIAEHIESREVLKIVNELGIDYSQGFLLGKPALTLD